MKKRKRGLLIGLCVGVGLLLACGITVFAFANYIQNPENAFSELEIRATPTPELTAEPTIAPLASSTPEATATPDPPETPPDYEFEKKRINILLLGADSSVERVEAGLNFRTDTMILVSVNFTDKKVDMISIPRDSYVRINGGNTRNKINAAFTFGGGAKKDGYQYAMNTVKEVLGVQVDYYVGFGMNVVKKVVDAAGGVDYDVDIAFTMNGRRLEKGLQHLDGQQVLDYCRFRHSGRGDVDRVERQQKILFALFEQMLSTKQIMNIPKIYQAVQEEIDTNLDFTQIATLAYFAKDLSMADLQRYMLPGDGRYIGTTSYYIIYQEQKNKMVKEIFGIEGPFDSSMTLAAIESAYLASHPEQDPEASSPGAEGEPENPGAMPPPDDGYIFEPDPPEEGGQGGIAN
ncbi:MAG: LCP family protein [Christensenellaceae bacterium]|jgi:LCP family protein required for cell wall assembly|nr:LCP family protein [Christensenellaceae bacterium]